MPVQEYGATPDELDKFAQAANEELDTDRKARRLKPFTGKLETWLNPPSSSSPRFLAALKKLSDAGREARVGRGIATSPRLLRPAAPSCRNLDSPVKNEYI